MNGGLRKHECLKCGATFSDKAHLARHQARKTPCDPIVTLPGDIVPPAATAPVAAPAAAAASAASAAASAVASKHQCRFCARQFSSKTSMYRHIRQSCKIANSDEGMEKLLDHTIRRQLAEQGAQITKLTALVEMLAVGGAATLPIRAASHQIAQTIHNGSVTNTTVVVNAWDGDRRIGVELAHILAAFTDNAKLREYARMGDHELTDPAIAPPDDLLMDLTKRAHADPAARNIYLNPRRADQVLVHKKSGTWEVLSLAEATRLLFDGVVATIHHTLVERQRLPLEAQNALSMAGLLYEDEPDEYVKRAKAPMAARLANTAPGAAP